MEEQYWLILLALSQGGLIAWKVVEKLISKKNFKASNNPHPCQKHEDWMKDLERAGEKRDIAITKLDQRQGDVLRRLDRIENKLNGMR